MEGSELPGASPVSLCALWGFQMRFRKPPVRLWAAPPAIAKRLNAQDITRVSGSAAPLKAILGLAWTTLGGSLLYVVHSCT